MRCGTDERDAGSRAFGREGFTLGQEAIARMNGLHAHLLGHSNNSFDVQVGRDRSFADANLVRLVRLETVQRETVFVRINCDGFHAEFVTTAKHANCDFRPVGGE